MDCCSVPAPTFAPDPQNKLRTFQSAIAALVVGLVAKKRVPRDLVAEASAAHLRAVNRAAGVWGGYQAARPVSPARRCP